MFQLSVSNEWVDTSHRMLKALCSAWVGTVTNDDHWRQQWKGSGMPNNRHASLCDMRAQQKSEFKMKKKKMIVLCFFEQISSFLLLLICVVGRCSTQYQCGYYTVFEHYARVIATKRFMLKIKMNGNSAYFIGSWIPFIILLFFFNWEQIHLMEIKRLLMAVHRRLAMEKVLISSWNNSIFYLMHRTERNWLYHCRTSGFECVHMIIVYVRRTPYITKQERERKRYRKMAAFGRIADGIDDFTIWNRSSTRPIRARSTPHNAHIAERSTELYEL